MYWTKYWLQAMTPPGGMWLIYKHEAREHKASECGVLIDQLHPDWGCQK